MPRNSNTPKRSHCIILRTQALREEKVRYVVAPYEADAQIAYLFRIGVVTAVIAEDSDMLAFGCQRVRQRSGHLGATPYRN